MIFDIEQAQELCARYADQPDFRVPQSVLLTRSEKLAGERAYLEGLVQSVSDSVRKGWAKRLLSDKHDQHLGAWFEIMLYGWLRQIGEVVAEPQVAGNNPDFLLSVGGKEIVVEAKALPIIDAERERDVRESELCWVLDHINRPFLVSVEAVAFGEPLNVEAFSQKVTNWLDHSPDEPFLFEDNSNNQMLLRAQRHPSLQHVATAATFPAEWIDPTALRVTLSNKAKQHQAIRKRGYPYVLAIMPESWKQSAEEIVTAWFGNEQLVIDFNTNEVIEQRIDLTGIHYFGREVVHKSVSGTLVFKREYGKKLKMHQLETWYVQNPYANVSLDLDLFPVQGKYVMMDKTDRNFKMGWRGTQNQ